jgi:hypothetical protein
MYGIQFVMKPGEDKDGFPVNSSGHVAYFPTPEDRAAFAAVPHVQSFRYLDARASDEAFYD